MARDSTVAPKERINIVYKSAVGTESEEVELPLKLVVVGDFTRNNSESSLEERPVISINKSNYDDVLAAQNVQLNMCVRNVMTENSAMELPVHLIISSLKDFEPDRVARQVPELDKLLELRAALTALKGPMGNVPAFRKILQSIIDDSGTRTRVLNELTTTQVNMAT